MTLAEKIENQLTILNDGQVTSDSMSDGSCRWVEIRRGNRKISIVFNLKGSQIEDIELFEDVVQVIDEKKLF